MSILAGLSKTKKFIINGVEIELKALPVDDDVSVLMEGKELGKGEQTKLMVKLVRKMLKQAIPDATESELSEAVRLDSLFPLMNAFYDVNGMTDKKNISDANKIKSVIESRKESISKQHPK